MDKLRFILLFAVVLLAGSAAAYDFESGGLYYNILDAEAKTVEVTSGGDGVTYSAAVVVPRSVSFGGITYMVKGIGENAFDNHYEIHSLSIADGIETIAYRAVASCPNLSELLLPSTLKSIGVSAFNYTHIKNPVLPEGLESIGNNAFSSCYNLTKVTLPSTLTSLGSNIFGGSRLSAVVSHIQEPSAIGNDVFNTGNDNHLTLYVPSGTKSAYESKAGWNIFNKIYEGEPLEVNVNGINYRYFDDSNEAIVIDGDYSNMESVTIPGSIPIYGTNYFVKEVGPAAFYYYNNIKTIVIEEGVEIINNAAFDQCTSITSIQFPSTLKTIGNSAFASCNQGPDIILPEGLESIGGGAFHWSNSKKIVLPSSLKSIGSGAFRHINNSASVTSYIQEPFAIDKNVFAYEDYWQDGVEVISYPQATLYVPEGTSEKYKALEGWNVFSEILEGEKKTYSYGGLIYSYIESDKTAKVIGRSDETLRDVIIPATVSIGDNTYAVKAIGGGAFYDISLNSVVIEDGIETIESEAFWDSDGINKLVLPSTLKSIGDRAFTWAYISKLDLPEGLVRIGHNAFNSCGNLKKVTLPSSLTEIGNNVFSNCNNLSAIISHIQVPFDVDENVFYSNSSATLYVPEGTKAAYEALNGWNKFADIVEGELYEETVDGVIYSYNKSAQTATVVGGDFSEYRKVTILGSVLIDGVDYAVKTIASGAFRNNYYIDSLIISSGIETIEKNAFYNCYRMRYVELPSTLTTIGEYAFAYCGNMQNLVLPSSLTSIGEFAFTNNNLTNVTSRIQSPFEINKSVYCRYESYWDATEQKNVETYTNPNATLYVPIGTKSAYEAYEGWNMFDGGIYEGDPKEGKSGIYSYIYMTDSKTATIVGADDIDQSAIELPATVVFDGDSYNVVGIGNEVFQSRYMKSVIIPDGYETIGKRAFYECYSLRSVKLPNSITSIGDDAFESCSVLDTISIPSKIRSIGYSAFWGTKITEVKIPATTTYIGRNAFAYCEALKSITVDANNSAYDSRNNCNALIEKATNTLMRGCGTTIIPNTVQIIGQHAFAGCLNLSDASIPNSVTTIEDNAFSNCRALTSVVIPSSVTKLYQQSFSGCSSLKSIRVDENNRTYDSRNNCNAVIETATKTLMIGCQSTIIPKGITSIADRSFHSCEKLDSIKIPYGVTYIGEYAFYNCSGLVYVEIPNSVQTLRYGAFENCNNIQAVVSKIKDPEGMNQMEWAFSGSYGSATLFVPNGTKQAYKNRYGWDNFYYIEEMIGDPLAAPTLTYDGRAVTATAPETDVDMYYSTDDFKTVSYYDGPITVSDLGTVKVIAEKTFRSDSEAAAYEVKYLYDGDTLKLAEAGLMAEAIKWCGTDSVINMTVIGPISTDEFSTISTLPNLKFLNLAEAKVDGASLPDGAFANSQIVSFVSPSSLSSVGSGIFRDCQQLAAVCWKASTALPADALSGVSNPNLLLYVNSEDLAPEGINNVVVDGKAKSITLTDATGNSNFYVPVAFHVTDTIKYTRNFQQKTQPGVSCGWETIVLPFNVKKITHETISNVTITPFADYNGWDNQRPFWLYTLDNNDIRPAYGIDANVPYLICMPNADEYGDQYNLAGNVTFSAANVDIAVSKPIEEAQGDITFVPTYQSVPVSTDVFTLNVNEEYKGYPAGSLFVSNFRDVRPFEAYSIHPSAVAKKVNEARMYTVSSLIGGDTGTTGIIDVMLKKNDGANSDAVVKVYSLSGALIKQGKAEDVTNGLPKGVYVANGKKFVVK